MPRRPPFIAATLAIVLMVALGIVLAVRASPFEFETEWMEEIIEHRSPWWLVPSLVMNFLGGGWFAIFIVPLGVAITLLAVRRP